ncbi:unnamed protein product [Fraxinus pennsylvanica]|uniref:Uncharacterized protein n=1 Tax=Fraxinus pennsylvanica TaxID=56036 RepID=A0AAD2ACN4_9LAMI|nr:unnamed protein product [Fraxinus pennsylvanica]
MLLRTAQIVAAPATDLSCGALSVVDLSSDVQFATAQWPMSLLVLVRKTRSVGRDSQFWEVLTLIGLSRRSNATNYVLQSGFFNTFFWFYAQLQRIDCGVLDRNQFYAIVSESENIFVTTVALPPSLQRR